MKAFWYHKARFSCRETFQGKPLQQKEAFIIGLDGFHSQKVVVQKALPPSCTKTQLTVCPVGDLTLRNFRARSSHAIMGSETSRDPICSPENRVYLSVCIAGIMQTDQPVMSVALCVCLRRRWLSRDSATLQIAISASASPCHLSL